MDQDVSRCGVAPGASHLAGEPRRRPVDQLRHHGCVRVMPAYFPFDPDPRVPAVTLPPLSCDSQFHVFGPREVYPVRPGAAYEMPSATIMVAMKMHRTLGLQRGVIVQPTTYGADHRAMLDGIAAAGENYRGCANAAVFESADDATLARLHAGAIRGARFSRQSLGIALSSEA